MDNMDTSDRIKGLTPPELRDLAESASRRADVLDEAIAKTRATIEQILSELTRNGDPTQIQRFNQYVGRFNQPEDNISPKKQNEPCLEELVGDLIRSCATINENRVRASIKELVYCAAYTEKLKGDVKTKDIYDSIEGIRNVLNTEKSPKRALSKYMKNLSKSTEKITYDSKKKTYSLKDIAYYDVVSAAADSLLLEKGYAISEDVRKRLNENAITTTNKSIGRSLYKWGIENGTESEKISMPELGGTYTRWYKKGATLPPMNHTKIIKDLLKKSEYPSTITLQELKDITGGNNQNGVITKTMRQLNYEKREIKSSDGIQIEYTKLSAV